MQATVDGEFLVIRIPLESPRPSSSGKTLIVASTHGNQTTTATIDGKPIIVGLNAYVRAVGGSRGVAADAPRGMAPEVIA